MKNSTADVMLADLEKRIQANQNGLLVLVKEAGIPTENVCVRDLEILYKMKAPQLKECIDILYAEIKDKNDMNTSANATGGTFDYFGFFGNVLNGIGSGLASQNGSNNNTEQLEAQYKAELAEKEAANQKRTLSIILTIVAFIIVAGVVVFVVRGRKEHVKVGL